MSTKDNDTTTTESTDIQTNDATADGLEAYLDLHGFKRDILRAIHIIERRGDESYGLEVKRQLEEWHGQPINHGRLYPNLDDLTKEGLVEKSALDKRTNQYALTPGGRGLVEAASGHFAGICNGGGA